MSDTPRRFVDYFADVVAARPDLAAVVANGVTATYAELDEWSAALAARILDKVGPGSEPVIIMSGHDLDAVAAFVAIARTGRPAVHVDTTTPQARIEQVMTIAGPVATVVGPNYQKLAGSIGKLAGVLIESGHESGDQRRPVAETDPDPVLGIIFTSGSTGAPKGVILGDTDLCTELGGTELSLLGGADERVAVPQPLSFIAGLSGIIRPLMSGATSYLYDPRRAGITGMVDWVVDNQLTTLSVTPHVMRSLARAAINRGITFDSVTTVMSGGEALVVTDVELMRQCTPPECVIFNASGSSEAWGVSIQQITRDYPLPASGQVPAGQAIGNRKLYLEDESGERITEPGSVGMIMIAAERMARGYWGNPEMTSERFSVDADGLRVYRTGDLGRWNERGELEYAGRSDHMLKIRGYLVEPAEVEAHLTAERETRDCVVVGLPDPDGGPTRLIAYVVPDPTRWVSPAAVRRRLVGEVPSYMVPQQIIEMQELPRNPNGKVDRAALPVPDLTVTDTIADGWNPLQRVVASICQNALGIETIGRQQDIFALGADSLAVEEILAALQKELGITLTSATLMDNPTVAQIADLKRPPRAELIGGVLVPLATSNTTGEPIFLIAGAGGLALQFRELARYLGVDRPVYGMQARGLEGPGLPDVTVAAMARRCTRAIKLVKPTGPYNIAGHSLGSIVAFEVARRLVASGNVVTMLGLLDPLGGASEGVAQRMKPDAPTMPRFGNRRPHSLTELRSQVGQERPYLTRTFWKNKRTSPFIGYWNLGQGIAQRYHFPRQPLRNVSTVVFAAADQEGSQMWDSARFIDPKPRVESVPGDHLSMLRAPYVDQLAAAIQRYLS
jgi:amino acid adenylation domain-containing protein